jgi:hypothetical protein
MAQCSQCGRPAIVAFSGHDLCIEHYRMLQETYQAQLRMAAANLNYATAQIEAAVGMPGLLPRYQIPSSPSNLTLTNITVSGGNVGVINTGTIQRLDSSITVMREHGNDDLARAIKELTNAVIASQEVSDAAKNEIIQQLDFLADQVMSDAGSRPMGVIKSVLAGMRGGSLCSRRSGDAMGHTGAATGRDFGCLEHSHFTPISNPMCCL